jgi:glycolate oxidase
MTERLRELGIEVVDRAGRAVALPVDTSAVVGIVHAAAANGWTVAPECLAGSGLSAGDDDGADADDSSGRSPSARVFLSLERLDSIDEVVPPDLMAVLGAGVTCAALNEQVAEFGLYWPGADVSEPDQMVGDTIAAASGNWTRAGNVLRRYLLGMEVVLADGEVLRTGSRTVKWVTGYDLRQLFVGSRGTLGIVTGLTLRLESLANRDAVNERYARDFEGLDALGDASWSGDAGLEESTSAPIAAGSLETSAPVSGAAGSLGILSRLKREFDPHGVFPPVETAFGALEGR